MPAFAAVCSSHARLRLKYSVRAVFLRAERRYRGDFAVVSAWGAVLAALMLVKGPWMQHMVAFFWPVQAAAQAYLLFGEKLSILQLVGMAVTAAGVAIANRR